MLGDSPKKPSNLNLKHTTTTTIKFVCSYGGKILPRHPDGNLRYHGGEIRIVSVDASISFSELLVKLGELCGTSVSLRCKLPSEDLDALVTIISDEDLANLIEEYTRSESLKIRAFLSLPKKISSPTSTALPKSPSASSFTITGGGTYPPRFPAAVVPDRCIRQMWKPLGFYQCCRKSVEGNPSCMHLIHNGNDLL